MTMNYTAEQIKKLKRLFFEGYPFENCARRAGIKSDDAIWFLDRYLRDGEAMKRRREAAIGIMPRLIDESIRRKKNSGEWLETLMRLRTPDKQKHIEEYREEVMKNSPPGKWVEIVRNAKITEANRADLLARHERRVKGPMKENPHRNRPR